MRRRLMMTCAFFYSALTGCTQVATAGFDGQIFVWATESGKAKFSMKPSDHNVGKVRHVGHYPTANWYRCLQLGSSKIGA